LLYMWLPSLGSRFFLSYTRLMKTEYEATFLNINKEDLTEKLKASGGNLERPEYMQRRVTLELPKEKQDLNTWLRVRDEGNGKITLTLKSVDGKTITGQKEILVEVNDFGDTVALLESIGCERKSYQESRRELWQLGDVEVAIDTWPFLDAYVELEGSSEDTVKNAAALLGFDYQEAIFDTVNGIYKQKYGKTLDELDKETLKAFTFDIKNPFI
jgi:adenylate cyclase class 2